MRRSLYFPGLDFLRAYAALSVVAHHLPPFSGHVLHLDPLFLDGWDAVTLFFVLSGFLITYLLLAEQHDTGRVNVAAFYRRRILRIWPLYFWVIGLTVVLLPTGTTLEGVVLAVLFLGDLAPPLMGALGMVWSIALEERFYFAYPLLARRLSVPRLVGLVLGIKVALLLLLALVPLAPVLRVLLESFRFEGMALGALGAWLVVTKSPALRLIYRLDRAVVAAVAVNIALSTLRYNAVYDLLLSTVFMLLIVNVATNPRPVLRVEHPVARALGRWSYGIYLYHTLIIMGLATFFRPEFLMPMLRDPVAVTLIWVVGFYPVVFAVTIGVAALSYRYLEAPFLRMKDRYRATALAPNEAIATGG